MHYLYNISIKHSSSIEIISFLNGNKLIICTSVASHSNNFKIGEVPVTMKERQGGVSSIGAFASVYYMFKVTLGTIFLFIRLKFNGKRHTI